MKVHHLDCATMCPRMAGLVNEKRHMVCHCLLVETSAGLVLIDTGLGTGDIADPARLGKTFQWLTRPRLALEQTALSRVQALGFSASDVRHIVVTHLDLDHAGGLPDFPAARVHVHEKELAAARARASYKDRGRYIPAHFAHQPDWVTHAADGESWFGLDRVRAIDGCDDEILLVPLFGHTLGHCAVAVRTPDHWLLHCGDAYFYHREVDPANPRCTFGLRVFQSIVETDRQNRLASQQRLRDLMAGHSSEIVPFCAHDPVELERLAAGRPG